MFDLKRPCKSCPFRKGMGSKFQLRRLEEIRRGASFQCHATVDYDASPDYDDGDDGHIASKKGGPQQCHGLMAVLYRMNEDNQIMRIAERIGSLDPAKLDPDNQCYATWTDVRRAHLKGIEP